MLLLQREVLSHWYNWTDPDILEMLLSLGISNLVVEVAAGPNIAVPHILKKKCLSSNYVSVDIEKGHIQLQKEGVVTPNMEVVVADATHLPVQDEQVDIFVFHHAIDDILESHGFEGLWASIEEALRTIKKGGCIIFSHCVFSHDPYTTKTNLKEVHNFLKGSVIGLFQEIRGSQQDWLIMRNIHIGETS